MFCPKCGAEQSAESIFCHNCGNKLLLSSNDNFEVNQDVDLNGQSNEEGNGNLDTIINCKNCGYKGPGRSGRNLLSSILALICILFFWPFTLIYYFITSKYKCPKCGSTSLEFKNKKGVFVKQKKFSVLLVLALIIFIIITIFIILGLLSTLAVTSFDDARIKARDARRVSDIKQIETALDLYYTNYNFYPSSLVKLQPEYIIEIPSNPKPNDGGCQENFEYLYELSDGNQSYRLTYCLGKDSTDKKAGVNIVRP